MKKFAKQRVCVLIDAENLEITTRRLHNASLDYRVMLDQINDREIIRAIYYSKSTKLNVTRKNGGNRTRGFIHFLQEGLGFEIKILPKDADTYLCMDAVSLAPKVDVAILVTGDKDYVPLLHYLKAQGVRTEVWSWESRTAKALQETADVFVALDAHFLKQ